MRPGWNALTSTVFSGICGRTAAVPRWRRLIRWDIRQPIERAALQPSYEQGQNSRKTALTIGKARMVALKLLYAGSYSCETGSMEQVQGLHEL